MPTHPAALSHDALVAVVNAYARCLENARSVADAAAWADRVLLSVDDMCRRGWQVDPPLHRTALGAWAKAAELSHTADDARLLYAGTVRARGENPIAYDMVLIALARGAMLSRDYEECADFAGRTWRVWNRAPAHCRTQVGHGACVAACSNAVAAAAGSRNDDACLWRHKALTCLFAATQFPIGTLARNAGLYACRIGGTDAAVCHSLATVARALDEARRPRESHA